MKERLEPLVFVPAPLEHAAVKHRPPSPIWRIAEQANTPADATSESKLALPSRLFWCDPPWYRYENSLASMIAIAVANFGVTVAATKWDLSTKSEITRFHDQDSANNHGITARSRMLPYRPERFGIALEDFDNVSAIDVRLLPERDQSGVPFFDVAKVAHYGAMSSDETQTEPQALPSLTIPPDISGIDQLDGKLKQLRSLSPNAAIFVSILPHRLSTDLPVVAAQSLDGLILRCDESSISGLGLIMSLSKAISLLSIHSPRLPVLLAPGSISVSDAIKLHRLGASAVAIDSWCDEVLEGVDDLLGQPAAGRVVNQNAINQIAEHHLADRIERFRASQHSQQVNSLKAKEEAWSNILKTFG